MNSSSEPMFAVHPRSASRSSWRRRIWRGEAATGRPSCHSRSATTIAVRSSQGTRRSVAMSGLKTKSPYPVSHDAISNPCTGFMSTSTVSR